MSLFIALSAGALVLFAQQQTQTPTKTLKVGARNSAIRNIGAFIVDSAIILPKRQASDTLHSQKLRKKGVFFYDTLAKKIYWYDGNKFRYLSEDNIYKTDGEINELRTVTIKSGINTNHKDNKKNSNALRFIGGRVEIDTLLIRKKRLGLSTDSILVTFNDTVRKIPMDSLRNNIYAKNGRNQRKS